MRKSQWRTSFAVLLCLTAVSCSTSRMRASYLENPVGGVTFQAAAWDGTSRGNVHADEGGAVWVNCRSLMSDAVEEVAGQARDLGANAIGNINWAYSDSSEPACEKRWGWVLFWPMLLTPIFENVEISATAYQVDIPGEGQFMLPLTREDVDEIIDLRR